jgi:hypothetical protein
MIQLAFEPAFDPFHAAFRVLRLAVCKGGEPTQLMRLKVLDLFLVEPRRCLEIRVPASVEESCKIGCG